MKYRQGFVSNSSSSSYLIAYDVSAILSNPKEIADYIDNNLRSPIMFKSDLCEGWDLFELDMKQKSYLLRHRKRFEKFCKGTVKYTDYTVNPGKDGKYPEIDIPFIQALTNVYRFYPYPYEWETPEVDMSDIPCPEMSMEESIEAHKEDASPELKEKARLQANWSLIKCNRQTEARHQKQKDYIEKIRQELTEEGADPSTLKVELIEVDHRSCDPDGNSDWEFPERYFGLDEDTWYEDIADSNDPDAEIDDDPEPNRVCPNCGYEHCGTINTGHESCIFCPSCHVRTAFYPVDRYENLLQSDWNNGKVFDMGEYEKKQYGLNGREG